MRQIKFRGWDGEEKRMWSWRELKHTHYCASLYSHGDGSWEVMQFTGLLDKNYNEIYEGDIVTDGTWASDNEIYKGQVVFLNGCFVVTCNNDCMSDDHVFGWNHLIYDLGPNVIEVIGNIYQHPELLEVHA